MKKDKVENPGISEDPLDIKTNVWVRHIYPENFEQDGIFTIQAHLESLVDSVSYDLVEQTGVSLEIAHKHAATIVTQQALALQRVLSSDGYYHLLSASYTVDPLLHLLRQRVNEMNQSSYRTGLVRGVVAGGAILWIFFVLMFIGFAYLTKN